MLQRPKRAAFAAAVGRCVRAVALIGALVLTLSVFAEVKVGMDEQALLAAKGKPTGSLGVGKRIVYEWPDLRVMVQDGKVVKVTYLTADAYAAAVPATTAITSENKALSVDIRKKAIADYEASQANKVIWAKHVLGLKGPDIEVEKWLTAEPATSGKFVLIDFWATWCPPCRRAIPVLNQISKEFADRLTVIGVSNETEAEVAKMTDPVIAYSVAIDPKERMERTLEVNGIPHAILIDPSGIVRWEGYPLSPGNELTLDVVRHVMDLYGPQVTAKN